MIVAALALRLGKLHVWQYACVESRKDFTQPQLMACLVLRVYLKATYQDFCDQLAAFVGVARDARIAPRAGLFDAAQIRRQEARPGGA